MSQPVRHVRLASSLSVGSAWDGLLRARLEAATEAVANGGDTLTVITPARSVAYYLKERALADGLSLAGVRFLVPTELRESLIRRFAEEGKVARREHLRLLLAAAAEAVSDDPHDAAAAVASAPDALLGALERLERAGWDILE